MDFKNVHRMPNPSWRDTRIVNPIEVDHSLAFLPFVFKLKEDSTQDIESVSFHLSLTGISLDEEVSVKFYWGIKMSHLYNLMHSTWDNLKQSDPQSCDSSANDEDSNYLATTVLNNTSEL